MNAAPRANCHAASSSAITGSPCDPYWSLLRSWKHNWTVNTQVKLHHRLDFSSLWFFLHTPVHGAMTGLQNKPAVSVCLNPSLENRQVGVWERVWNCSIRSFSKAIKSIDQRHLLCWKKGIVKTTVMKEFWTHYPITRRSFKKLWTCEDVSSLQEVTLSTHSTPGEKCRCSVWTGEMSRAQCYRKLFF